MRPYNDNVKWTSACHKHSFSRMLSPTFLIYLFPHAVCVS